MVSKEQRRRRLAREHAERQAARRAEQQARRRRRSRVLGAVLAVAVVVAGVLLGVRAIGGDDATDAAGSPTASPTDEATTEPTDEATTEPTDDPTDEATDEATDEPSNGPRGSTTPCRYRADGDLAPGVRLPGKDAPTDELWTVTLTTNRGPVVVEMDSSLAPCTVNAFVTLARAGVLDGATCPLLSAGGAGDYLACGDVRGSTGGSAGFLTPTESTQDGPFTAGQLLAVPVDGRGTLTRFLVVTDRTEFRGPRTVFGTVTKGLDVVDDVVAAGVAAGGDDPDYGEPARATVIRRVTVEKA